MLIDRGITEGEIVSLKLVNGDEIIAKFERETNEDVTLHKPLAITIGAQGLGMIPWLFLGNKEQVTIKKTHLFVMMPSKKEAADQYTEGTTGIALK